MGPSRLRSPFVGSPVCPHEGLLCGGLTGAHWGSCVQEEHGWMQLAWQTWACYPGDPLHWTCCVSSV